jgi:hypothetical protein
MTEKWTSGTGQKLTVHSKDECKGETCPIHNPSDHHMIDFPTHWRMDKGIMERICPHGIGHPDPDDYSCKKDNYLTIHGCDGCCSPEGYKKNMERDKENENV